jgi:hypothetical protein
MDIGGRLHKMFGPADRRRTAADGKVPSGESAGTRNAPRRTPKEPSTMADETQPTPAPGEQSVQLLLDEAQMKTSFANAYRIHTTAEEVVLDFGFNMANPNPQGGNQQLLFRVNDRVILSYPNVKRLALSLQQLVRQYEQRMGEIPMNPMQPKAAR